MTIYLRMGPLMSPPIEVPDGTTKWQIPVAIPLKGRYEPLSLPRTVGRKVLFVASSTFLAGAHVAEIFDYVG